MINDRGQYPQPADHNVIDKHSYFFFNFLLQLSVSMKSFSLSRINRCDFYMAAWFVYYLQGLLYEVGGTLSTGLLGILFLVSLYYVVLVLQLKNSPVYFKGLTLLLLMFTIYGLGYILVSPNIVHYRNGVDMVSYNYIKQVYLSLLSIYPFYYFSRMGYLDERKIKFWFYLFIVSATLTYFKIQRDTMFAYDSDDITNNGGYVILSLFPGLLLFRGKMLKQFLFLGFIMIFVVMSMKRGTMLVAGVVTVYYLWEVFKNTSKKTKFWFLILSIIFVFLSVKFIEHLIDTSYYLGLRIENTRELNYSGRDDTYSILLNHFLHDSSIVTFILGNGPNATLNICNRYAHNDWLEIAINQGVLGLCIYAFYWLCFYKTVKKCSNSNIKIGLGILFIIYYMQTLFSMSYNDMSYLSTSVLGYYLANYRNTNICSS